MMYISLKNSCSKGFKKWADAHEPQSQAPVGDEPVADDPGLDSGVMTPPEQPHRPWLVPGAGTL